MNSIGHEIPTSSRTIQRYEKISEIYAVFHRLIYLDGPNSLLQLQMEFSKLFAFRMVYGIDSRLTEWNMSKQMQQSLRRYTEVDFKAVVIRGYEIQDDMNDAKFGLIAWCTIKWHGKRYMHCLYTVGFKMPVAYPNIMSILSEFSRQGDFGFDDKELVGISGNCSIEMYTYWKVKGCFYQIIKLLNLYISVVNKKCKTDNRYFINFFTGTEKLTFLYSSKYSGSLDLIHAIVLV